MDSLEFGTERADERDDEIRRLRFKCADRMLGAGDALGIEASDVYLENACAGGLLAEEDREEVGVVAAAANGEELDFDFGLDLCIKPNREASVTRW